MPRRDSLVQVELLEADEPVGGEPERPRRRRWWWVLLVPVVVVLVGLGVQAIADARERSADARVAALPGAVDPVGESIDELWRSDAAVALAWGGGGVAQDAVHGMVVGRDGSLSYAAVDLGTGATRWSTPLRDPDPILTWSRVSGGSRCQAMEAPDDEPDTVACLLTDGYQAWSSTGEDESRLPTESRVVVVDLADGRVLADHPVAPVLSVAFLPGLVASAVVDDSRRVVVTAIDPLTGTELWRYREDRAFPVTAGDLPVISAAGGMVVLSGTSGAPVLLSATGARVDPGPVESGWNITWQGWFTTEHSDPERGQVQRVFRPGEPPVEVAGRLLDRRVDDGSAPGLEVSAREKTFGWDSRTGERRWQADISADPEGSDAVLVIDGTVFLVGPKDVVALDAETGATVWTSPRLVGSYSGELFTDGAHLLLVEAPEDAGSTGYVTILDRRDGGFVHRLALPDGAAFVVPVGRHLITVDGNEIVGLG